jgi:hypothetical protein
MRAYSHQGHGPRADQTGRIHISDFRFLRTISLAKRSRSIHSGQSRRFRDAPKKSGSRPITDVRLPTYRTWIRHLWRFSRFLTFSFANITRRPRFGRRPIARAFESPEIKKEKAIAAVLRQFLIVAVLKRDLTLQRVHLCDL